MNNEIASDEDRLKLIRRNKRYKRNRSRLQESLMNIFNQRPICDSDRETKFILIIGLECSFVEDDQVELFPDNKTVDG